MNRAGQQGDAVLADLVAEVLAGDADSTRAGRAQDIKVQVVPLLSRGRGKRGGHSNEARTPVLLVMG
jgi:hypothetical protein